MAAAMMSAFALESGLKVVAVASESRERADNFAKRFGIPQAYGGIEQLLADTQIEAVYIANMTEHHAQGTLKALRAGKAVLCEKPIAISASESKEIEQEATHANKLCMEAMWTFFLPAYQRLFALCEAKVLGTPLHLYSDFGYPVSKEAYPRLFSPTPGSGVLLDRSVYPIALALKLLGPVSQVLGKVDKTEEGVDTHAIVQLIHADGCQSQLAVSVDALLQNRAVLSGTGGTISLEPPVIGAEMISISRITLATQPEASSGNAGSAATLKQKLRQIPLLRRIKSMGNSGKREYYSYGASQYSPVINHFCNLFRAEKLVSDIYPLSVSTQVLHIVDQIKKL